MGINLCSFNWRNVKKDRSVAGIPTSSSPVSCKYYTMLFLRPKTDDSIIKHHNIFFNAFNKKTIKKTSFYYNITKNLYPTFSFLYRLCFIPSLFFCCKAALVFLNKPNQRIGRFLYPEPIVSAH